MNPLNKNKLIEEFAKETGIDPDLASVVITMYWKEVRLTMNEMLYPRIRIPGFGTMVTLRGNLEKAIIKNKSILGNIPPTSFQNVEKYRVIEEKVKKLEKLKAQLNKEREDHEKFKQQKNKS